MIVDAHAHLVPEVHGSIAVGPTRGLGYGRVAIGREEIQFLPPLNELTVFTPEMLLAHMDWGGVDRAVLLQGPFYGECNRDVLEAVARYPGRLIGAAYLDPWSFNCHETFESISACRGFRAVKLECSEATGLCGIHPNARLDAPEIGWLWEELARRELTLVIDLGAVGSRSYQTDAVRAIAEKHPHLRIVIAHLAQPTPAVEADAVLWSMWERQIETGRLPNVWFDTASLPAYVADEGQPYPTASRYLRVAVDRIGPSKLIWGSDVPGLLTHATYPQLVKLAKLHLQFLSAADCDLILGGNSQKVFNLQDSNACPIGR